MNEYVIRIREKENDGLHIDMPQVEAADEMTLAQMVAYILNFSGLSMTIEYQDNPEKLREELAFRVKQIERIRKLVVEEKEKANG